MLPVQSAPHLGLERVSSARRFLGDAIIAFSVLNEARHRAVGAVFGASREADNLVTLFVIGAFARAVHRGVATPRTQVHKVRSSPTAVGDTMIGTAALKETLDSVAGHPSRSLVFFGRVRPTLKSDLRV